MSRRGKRTVHDVDVVAPDYFHLSASALNVSRAEFAVRLAVFVDTMSSLDRAVLVAADQLETGGLVVSSIPEVPDVRAR